MPSCSTAYKPEKWSEISSFVMTNNAKIVADPFTPFIGGFAELSHSKFMPGSSSGLWRWDISSGLYKWLVEGGSHLSWRKVVEAASPHISISYLEFLSSLGVYTARNHYEEYIGKLRETLSTEHVCAIILGDCEISTVHRMIGESSNGLLFMFDGESPNSLPENCLTHCYDTDTDQLIAVGQLLKQGVTCITLNPMLQQRANNMISDAEKNLSGFISVVTHDTLNPISAWVKWHRGVGEIHKDEDISHEHSADFWNIITSASKHFPSISLHDYRSFFKAFTSTYQRNASADLTAKQRVHSQLPIGGGEICIFGCERGHFGDTFPGVLSLWNKVILMRRSGDSLPHWWAQHEEMHHNSGEITVDARKNHHEDKPHHASFVIPKSAKKSLPSIIRVDQISSLHRSSEEFYRRHIIGLHTEYSKEWVLRRILLDLLSQSICWDEYTEDEVPQQLLDIVHYYCKQYEDAMLYARTTIMTMNWLKYESVRRNSVLRTELRQTYTAEMLLDSGQKLEITATPDRLDFMHDETYEVTVYRKRFPTQSDMALGNDLRASLTMAVMLRNIDNISSFNLCTLPQCRITALGKDKIAKFATSAWNACTDLLFKTYS